MAAIDKLHFRDWEEFVEFRIWCIQYKPDLLLNFYSPFMSWSEWDDAKKSTVHSLSKIIDSPDKDSVAYLNGLVEDIAIPCCNFRFDQDRFLLWHCPLPFIRDYLYNQCGYKHHWYYELFFKGKKEYDY